ncbi:MAG: hypothetical protein P1V19_19295 [Gimesia sp.]|nr:hypothetical protein [Gimesia sp.]
MQNQTANHAAVTARRSHMKTPKAPVPFHRIAVNVYVQVPSMKLPTRLTLR